MSSNWSLAPVLALRHTGFPLDMTGILAAEGLGVEADNLETLAAQAHFAAAETRQALRGHRRAAEYGSWLGQLLPLPDAVLSDSLAHTDGTGAIAVLRYQTLVTVLADAWEAYRSSHDSHLAVTRAAVVAAFRDDDLLREVLLLSNDRHYPQYAQWLAGAPQDLTGKRGRTMTDLLARYLQRVTSKNETHSHFGPIAAGRFDPALKGIAWREDRLERTAFFAHWAADRLAVALTPPLLEHVRPRRRPWAFRQGDRVTLYAFTTETGFAADWRFTHAGSGTISAEAAWLFDECDGEQTIAALRDRFPYPDFDAALHEVTERGWVVARFEIPIGDPDPLAALAHTLPGDATAAHEVIARLRRLLTALENGDTTHRPAVITELKEVFQTATGQEPNRGDGRHYADRSVFFEEAHSAVADLCLGEDVAAFIRDDMSPIYDIALLGPRLRLWRETRILGSWLDGHFGAGADVPLDAFYARYFDDRPALLSACDTVDAELSELDRQLTAVLLSGPVTRVDGTLISNVPVEELRRFIGENSRPVPAVCNPDVMIAARDAAAIAGGDFLAVIGDCHALREVLTHTSFTPLLATRMPDLASTMFSRYREMLEDDELLCDMARSHPNKTGSQVLYPCPDVEIFGRSAKPRPDVIQPGRLYLSTRDGVAQLRAHGLAGRIRLTAPPAGGPSIRQDPLSPFSFPRHFGGIGLAAADRAHLPRLVHGRVVLHRETWRVPAARLRGLGPTGQGRSGDAAEFFAAQRLRRRLGLPRYVFAKVASEVKPVLVDFSSPLLVRQLCRMARTDGGTVTISEMLPGPDQLWLEIGGRRHTSELRCAVFSSGR